MGGATGKRDLRGRGQTNKGAAQGRGHTGMMLHGAGPYQWEELQWAGPGHMVPHRGVATPDTTGRIQQGRDHTNGWSHTGAWSYRVDTHRWSHTGHYCECAHPMGGSRRDWPM